ncbi:hypothetical protein TNCV_1255691 [Trichonephila clavipes]|nr:hypothetical protein TNCV_1255691 [Trichonephila clavipes]
MTDEEAKYVGRQCTIMSREIGFPNTRGNSSRNKRREYKCLTAFVAIHSLAVFYKSHHVVQTSPASSTLSLGCYGWKGWQLYFRLVDVGALLRAFQSIPICQTIRPPRPSRQRCVAGPQIVSHHDAKVKIGDSRCLFNILNAEQSSLATSFAPQSQCGLGSGGEP